MTTHAPGGLVERGHDVYFYTAPNVQSKSNIIPGDEITSEPFDEDTMKVDEEQTTSTDDTVTEPQE